VIVVDSNILAYLYLPSDFTDQAEQLLASDPDWIAPILWRSEFRNILAGYMRRGVLTLDQAYALQVEAEGLLSGREFDVDSLDVLAKKQGIKLATMDKKVLRNFPERTFSIENLAH